MQYAAKIQIVPAHAPVGAEVVGVDLSRDLQASEFTAIEDAYAQHGVIFLRNQSLSEQQLIDVTARFGAIVRYVRDDFALADYPEIILITNLKKDGQYVGVADAGTTWHTDMSYIDVPPRGSLLYAREVPVENGEPLGDTLFASTASAYDDLPSALKKRLGGRRTMHSYEGKHARRALHGKSDRKPLSDAQKEQLASVDHPVIRTHEITGRKCIYVVAGECTGISGLPDDEAAPLLEDLAERCTRPEYIYRHRWQAGDLVIWDNCLVQHLAIHDYALPQRRLMWRTTIQGSAPV